jgi:hypothetical protein
VVMVMVMLIVMVMSMREVRSKSAMPSRLVSFNWKERPS